MRTRISTIWSQFKCFLLVLGGRSKNHLDHSKIKLQLIFLRLLLLHLPYIHHFTQENSIKVLHFLTKQSFQVCIFNLTKISIKNWEHSWKYIKLCKVCIFTFYHQLKMTKIWYIPISLNVEIPSLLFEDMFLKYLVWLKWFYLHIYEEAVNETLCANFKCSYQRSLCLAKYEIATKKFSSYQTYKACNSSNW